MSRAVFCGNFEYDARNSEIERLFDRYGRVKRVDMKTGFAFVYMEDERDAEDAIRDLDCMEFGRQRRRLKVEWAKGDGPVKQREIERKNTKPTKTLFVVNFDPINTRSRDIERHFESYGKLVRVQIRKNFAFVQFEELDDAIEAVKNTNNTLLDGRVITVEFAAREDSGTGGRYDDDYDRDRDRDRGGDRRRSPDYGRYRSRSRSPPRRNRSRSPDYEPYKK